ncbi:MAG: hda [Gammaproteobacteria bacterium]|jgi:DnaA family protein|nr:hda [Gammaproteobacteria bacterium]
MKTPNQLILGVGLKDEATFSNFFLGKNIQLVTALKNAAQGEGERVIYFYGTNGQGCTHLLQACCHAAQQAKKSAVYLPLNHYTEFSPEIFEGLESLNLVCVDDVHCIVGKSDWEEALFHIYNRIQDKGGRLIATANVAPKALEGMPDMISRLAWGIVFQLQPLSDAEKLEAIIMRAERRGIMLSEEVGKFILTHCPRHMSTLFAVLEVLDKMSLAAQRKLTIPFVKEILQI